MKPTIINNSVVMVICLYLAYMPELWAADAAILQKVNGVAFVTHPNGKSDLVHEGLGVNVGDTVNTEKDSSLMLVFADKGQVALRPETSFQIKAFHYEEAKPVEDNLVIALLKGGLRTVTGLVSKRGNRDAYKLESANATMGIRGTDFNARLCDSDCQNEQAHQYSVGPLPSGTIGRIVELEGNLNLAHGDGAALQANKLQPLFENDQLNLDGDGQALLVFIDGTRMLLQAGAKIKLREYHYDQAKPEIGKILFEMSAGNVRIGGGMIGKNRPEQVQIITQVASVAMPSANFDLKCGRDEDSNCDSGLYVSVRDGNGLLKSGSQSLALNKGVNAYAPDPTSPAILLDQTPKFIAENSSPLPELIAVQMDKVFGMGAQEIPTGLYVSVNDGSIVLNQGGLSLETSKGESAFAPSDGSSPLLLPNTPAFVNYDAVLGRFPFIPGLCSM
ncbi:MAG: hypothetical protein BVN35_17215 [Proteobacteria bacterium ST_bin11]|nr:MAG: hypothetical protein BVN35_17215 [Proteobacteria bacterium ST_bin11]